MTTAPHVTTAPRGETRRGAPTTLLDAYRHGVAILRDAGVDNARHEAFWLLEAVLGRSRLAVYAGRHDRVAPDAWERTEAAFRRRAAREPLQYIIGVQAFLGRDFLVRPGVFIPRPDTELIVEDVLAACTTVADTTVAGTTVAGTASVAPTSAVSSGAADDGPIVDVGTGTGCLAVSLALACPGAVVYATDCSAAALRLARDNAVRHGVGDRVGLILGDGLAPLCSSSPAGSVAVMVSNPPYIPSGDIDDLPPDVRLFEPRLALDGGPDGLAWYDRLLTGAVLLLRPGGVLVMEMGVNQAADVRRMVRGMRGLSVSHIRRDAAGIERVMRVERTG